jgi:glycerol-3-phosphate dehydrogenase (NAD(P)+)
MHRFAKHYGAKEETFIGLSGAGDLFLTANSTLSRNYRVGLGLAQGKKQEEILKELGEVAEGIGTTYALHSIAQKENLYLPIAREVYNILEGKDVQESLRVLLSSKEERKG